MKQPGELSVDLLDAAVELLGRAGRRGTVRVQGQSMLPTLRPGQRLAVDFTVDRPRCGDLLLFRQADYLVVHRLLGPASGPEGEHALRTRGDGLPNLDPRLAPSRIVARVIAVETEGGQWWDLRARGARAYARALAWHDLAWAAAAVVAARLDRVSRRLGLPAPFRSTVVRFDRGLLRLAHRGLFPRLHRSTSACPTEPDAGNDVGGPSRG